MIKAINITLDVMVALSVGFAGLLFVAFVGNLAMHLLTVGGLYLGGLFGHS